MNNNRKALKSGLWYTISDFLTKSVGLITTPIFTRLLTHAQYGSYSTYLSWQSVFSVIATLQLGSTFISARYDYEDDFDKYIFSMQTLCTISVIMWCAIINLIYSYCSTTFGIDRVYINSIFLYLIFHSSISMFQLRERYYFKYKASVAISLYVTVSTSLLSVVLVVIMEDKLAGRIIGAVLPIVLIGIVFYVYIARKGNKLVIKYWKYALPICLPFIPHLLSLTVLNSVDRIMITDYLGEEQTALYSVAYSCGALITMLLTSMNTAFAPWLGEKLHEDKRDEINSFSTKYVLLFMMLAIGVMLIAPELLLLIGGKSYTESLYVIPPVACGCIFQFVYTMHVNVEQYKKRTIGMAIASVSAAGLNYVLNYVFIPIYGYTAAAYTTLAGYVWLTIAHMYLVHRIKCDDVYNRRLIAIVLFGALAITIAINFLYMINIFRWIVIVLYTFFIFCVLYRNKTEILSFIGKKEKG